MTPPLPPHCPPRGSTQTPTSSHGMRRGTTLALLAATLLQHQTGRLVWPWFPTPATRWRRTPVAFLSPSPYSSSSTAFLFLPFSSHWPLSFPATLPPQAARSHFSQLIVRLLPPGQQRTAPQRHLVFAIVSFGSRRCLIAAKLDPTIFLLIPNTI